MPRTLPWLKSGSSSTTVAHSKRPSLASTPIQKRTRTVTDSIKDSSFSTEEEGSSTRKERAQGGKLIPDNAHSRGISRDEERPRSSSPPASSPTESFMEEGMEDDDKYRMVEDEFLSIAQRFTVHLHAAEYKRQQKMAKTRNAETISSISRPVTGKMPDQTKKKLEAIERANFQRTIFQGLVAKKSYELSDDSDDDVGLPYVGTSLHGLMDSPSKKKASLKKISGMVTTRAAAGYKEPAQSKFDQRRSYGSPEPRLNFQGSKKGVVPDGDAMEPSSDDDDLDAASKPIRLVKEVPAVTKASITIKKEVKTSVTRTDGNIPPRSKGSMSSFTNIKKEIKQEAPPTEIESLPKVRSRISRFELARARKMKEEEEQEAKKKLDVIPSFL